MEQADPLPETLACRRLTVHVLIAILLFHLSATLPEKAALAALRAWALSCTWKIQFQACYLCLAQPQHVHFVST